MRVLRRIARQCDARVFVETGTYQGDTLKALRRNFDQLHSIELSQRLHGRAAERFAGDRKVRLWCGDSGDLLSEVLECVDKPALLWLDGHYSGGDTALGSEVTPIFRELKVLAQWPWRASYSIVIDDARLFNGTEGYPTLEALRAEAEDMRLQFLRVEYDMIVLRPKQ